ncbi:MAG: hypothetical protein ACYTFO_03440 [Planctomycetota bacterium]|jgi:hypothetical protein
MAMSRDERRKIYLTERIRLKARADYEHRKPVGCGCLIVLLCLLGVGIVIFISRSDKPPAWWPKWLHRPSPTTQPADDAEPPEAPEDPAPPAEPADPQPDTEGAPADPNADDPDPAWLREPAAGAGDSS